MGKDLEVAQGLKIPRTSVNLILAPREAPDRPRSGVPGEKKTSTGEMSLIMFNEHVQKYGHFYVQSCGVIPLWFRQPPSRAEAGRMWLLLQALSGWSGVECTVVPLPQDSLMPFPSGLVSICLSVCSVCVLPIPTLADFGGVLHLV